VNIKYGPISDENLADALKHHGAEDIDIHRMAEELRARRAADLTAAEREDLHALRLEAQRRLLGGDAYDISEQDRRCQIVRAIHALARVLGGGE
jgi:hypothetical protein